MRLVRSEVEERAYIALDIIDRYPPLSPRVTAAFTALAAAMNELYGPLPPSYHHGAQP